jgi:thiamine-monophosphate kinase
MEPEAKLIARIKRAFSAGRKATAGPGLRVGIGDDAAILRLPQRADWVVSCDAFLEGVHFLAGVHPPDSVGYKALARATSDLAAMGATPRFFVLSLALPAGRTGVWLDHLLVGMRRAARRLGLRLIGGDTSRYPRVVINITVLGEIEHGRALLRSGARPGDLIYVSGRLGSAQLGLEMLRRGLARKPGARRVVQTHLYPRIRIALGRWLAGKGIGSAMMDISDGLSTDLARLCEASEAGGRVFAERVPQVILPRLPAGLSGLHAFDPLEMALHGGDDYELLFTVPHRRVRRLRGAPGASELRCIGEITRKKQIVLVEANGRERPLESGGWDPFRAKPRQS